MANNKVWLRYDDNNMHSKCILKVLFHLEIQCHKDISVVRISFKISIQFKISQNFKYQNGITYKCLYLDRNFHFTCKIFFGGGCHIYFHLFFIQVHIDNDKCARKMSTWHCMGVKCAKLAKCKSCKVCQAHQRIKVWKLFLSQF